MENANLASIQMAFRYDDDEMAGEKSFMYSLSKSNIVREITSKLAVCTAV